MSASLPPIDYRALFRHLPGSYLLLAADGTIVDNSDEHVAVSLLPREQAVGRNIFDAYPSAPDSQRDLAASHEEVRRTLRPHTMPLLRYDLERPAALGGGTEERYWQITHYPLPDADGHLQYILQIPQDVTETHRAALQSQAAQAALDEAHQRTSFILENLSVLIWTATAQGQRNYFNPRWLAFTGRTHEQESGDGWAECVHADDRARVLATWRHSVATGKPYQIEFRLRRHDGMYRWVLARATPRHDAQGQVNMWVGGATDIHEQRQMVQELLEANEQQALLAEQAAEGYRAAERQRETFLALFNQAPALIAIMRGPEHYFEYVNPPYQAVFPERQLQGLTLAQALPEIAEQGFVGLLDHVFHSGEPYHGNEVPVTLPSSDDGSTRLGYYNFSYQQFQEHGLPAGVMVFAYEVSELVQARQVLEKIRTDAPSAPDAAPTA